MIALPARRTRRGLLSVVLLLLVAGLGGCGGDIFEVGASVAPIAGEDLKRSCRFEIVLAPVAVQQGVLVLYERGDTEDLYRDATLREQVAALGYAIVFAHECDARSSGDLQAEASKGPGRMLFVALSELAQQTAHPELASAKVVLYGFSAAGVLTATMANEYPERLLGTIQYAAGSAYLDLDDVTVTAAAEASPTLILANAEDDYSGTSRSFRYFQRGRAQGAVWAYAVQNGTDHCCTLSTRGVVLPWLRAVATAAGAAKPGATRGQASAGTTAYFVCTPDGIEDKQGETDCSFSKAGLTAGADVTDEKNGWLPDSATATAWLAWVTSPGTN